MLRCPAQRDLLERRASQRNLLQRPSQHDELRRRRLRGGRLWLPLLSLEQCDELGVLIDDLGQELNDLRIALIAAAVAEETGSLHMGREGRLRIAD